MYTTGEVTSNPTEKAHPLWVMEKRFAAVLGVYQLAAK